MSVGSRSVTFRTLLSVTRPSQHAVRDSSQFGLFYSTVPPPSRHKKVVLVRASQALRMPLCGGQRRRAPGIIHEESQRFIIREVSLHKGWTEIRARTTKSIALLFIHTLRNMRAQQKQNAPSQSIACSLESYYSHGGCMESFSMECASLRER